MVVLLFLFMFGACGVCASLVEGCSFVVEMKSCGSFCGGVIGFALMSGLVLFLVIVFVMMFLSVVGANIGCGVCDFGSCGIDGLICVVFFSVEDCLVLGVLIVVVMSVCELLGSVLLVLADNFVLIDVPTLSGAVADDGVASMFGLPLCCKGCFVCGGCKAFVFSIYVSVLCVYLFDDMTDLLVGLISGGGGSLSAGLLWGVVGVD